MLENCSENIICQLANKRPCHPLGCTNICTRNVVYDSVYVCIYQLVHCSDIRCTDQVQFSWAPSNYITLGKSKCFLRLSLNVACITLAEPTNCILLKYRESLSSCSVFTGCASLGLCQGICSVSTERVSSLIQAPQDNSFALSPQHADCPASPMLC